MIGYLPVILICSMSVPDSECKEHGKDVTVMTAGLQNTPMSCIMEGYQRLSRTAYAPRAEDKYYVKVKCIPTNREYQ